MRSQRNKKGMRHVLLMARGATVAAVLAMSPAAWAVPSQVTLEGALTSSGGGAAPDGTYNVVFAIYKDVSGGNPIWSEGPVAVAVKNGLFQYSIGSKTPLAPAALANLATAFLGVKVEADAELPRQQLLSTAYALRAGLAEGVDCSGCIGAAALDPSVLAAYAKATDLAAYAKTTDLGAYAKTASLKPVATTGAYSDLSGAPVLALVATSGKYSDLSGGPDLTPYVKASALKAIATTGAYSDLSGAPVLAKVATTGSYFDMVDEPVPVKLGAACGTGLVMKGIKADGSYDCAVGGGGPIDPKNLPADGIDEISNGLIFNQFNDTFSGAAGTKILDNSPIGVSDSIAYPDIGLSQKLTVTIDVANSDISTLTISLSDPAGVEYVLYKKGATGTAIKTSYPAPTLPVSGDLTTWIGKNPVGKWTIKVVDTGYLNNAFDGAINSWSITSQTLSNKKIAVAGNMGVAGDVAVAGSTFLGNEKAACDLAHKGALRYEATAGLQVCQSNVATDNSVTYTWAAAIAQPIIWSGGCKSHSQGNGWATYCLDGSDFNTAGNYLSVDPAGVVTVKVSGYYRLDFYTIQHGCGQQDLQFVINGAGFAYSHVANRNWTGWRQNALADVAKLKAGDTFYVQAYRSNDYCNSDPYRWHSWSASGNHSRLQMTYNGPLAN